MTIQIKHIAVITRRFSLESNYPGGVNQLIIDSPSNAFSQDNFLVAVHFNSPGVAKSFIKKLTRKHLIYSPDGYYSDILLLNYSDAKLQHCDWLVVDGELGSSLYCHSILEQTKQTPGLSF